MPAIQGSGEISFSDIAANNSSASLSDISLQAESIRFASASVVGDVDGNGTGGQASDRAALTAAPHALSEFYDANFPSSIITGITFATVGSDTNTVDDENLGVTFTTNGTSGTYTVRLIDSSGNSDLSGTRSGAGTVTFTNLQLTEDTYRPQVEFNSFNVVNDDATFTHHDQLDGESTSLSYTSANVDAADESVSNVVVTPAVSTGTQESSSIATSVVTAGDGGDISATVSSISNQAHTMAIANVPGVLRFTSTHIGDPSAARNSETSTADLTITYNSAIDGIAVDDTTINSGVEFTISATSEGVQSKTLKMGYGTANNNTTYTDFSNFAISDTRFVRSGSSFKDTITLTSGTSLSTFFPKAHYTDDTGTLVAGSSFTIAPAFSYNTPGDSTMNVNETVSLNVSSVVGNNAAVAITSSPDKGSGTDTATLTPGTLNDVYTITYTGTANFSQTNNQTDTITVNPTVSVAKSAATGTPTADTDGVSISSTSHGLTATTFTFTPTTVGTSLGFTYSMASGFSFTSGNANTAGAIQGTFNSAGTKNSSLQVASNGTSATDAFSVTMDSITKDFDSCSTEAVNDGGMRAGGDVDVTLQVDFVKRAKLQRQLADSSFEDITGTTTISHGGGLNQSGDTTFTLLSNATPDGTQRTVRIVDVDRTANTIVLPNNVSASSTYTMLAPLAVVNSFSATAPGTIGRITISWNVSNAKTTSGAIVIKRSTASNMSSPTTIVTTTTAADSFNDDSLAGNTTFYYQLTALNASDESANSSIVNATTPLNTQWSSVPTVSVPFFAEESFVSDVFAISLTQGTGNTTVAIDSSTIAGHLTQNEIEIALSTSDTTPSSFVRIHGAGSAVSRTISHTSGVLYFAFRVSDDEGDIDASSDDAFTMSFTNNSITQNVSGVFRNHAATSTDSSLSQTFQEGSSQLSSATTFVSDNIQVSISGCTVGDIVTFRCDRTNGVGDLGDITVKLAAYNSDGASTAAYDSSGNLKSGALESNSITSTATGQALSGITLSSSGLARFRVRFRAQSDGTLNATGPDEEDAIFRLKVKVENSSGTTINNETLYTYTVAANPLS